MQKSNLHGYVPAIVTAFCANGAIMEDAFAEIFEFLIGRGATAICIAGDNGESWALNAAERGRLVRLGKDVVQGRVPVILYKSPRRMGFSLNVDVTETLANNFNIIGIKESQRDFFYHTHLLARLADRLAIMTGPCHYILPAFILPAFILPAFALGAAGSRSIPADQPRQASAVLRRWPARAWLSGSGRGGGPAARGAARLAPCAIGRRPVRAVLLHGAVSGMCGLGVRRRDGILSACGARRAAH